MLRRTLAALLSLQCASLPAYADALAVEDGRRQIEVLTTEILHKEIDLERYYLNYRVIGTREPRTRQFRYYLLQVGSASCTLAANIVYTKLAAKGLHSHGGGDFGLGDANRSAVKASSNSAVRNALRVGMIGSLLDGGSSALELGSNGWIAVSNMRRGFAPRAAVRAVAARVKEIDALMRARAEVIQRHDELRNNEVYQAETEVLKGLRDWCLSEFGDIYAEVKSTQSSVNLYYLLDIISCGVYLADYVLFFRSLGPGHATAAGSGLTTAYVGDAITMADVPISTISGRVLYKYWRNRLKKRLNEPLVDTEKETMAAVKRIEQAIASRDGTSLDAPSAVEARVAAYALWATRYDKAIESGLEQERREEKVALQGEISGPLIGGTYLAQDILAAEAYYHLPNNNQAGSSLALAGAITSAAGATSSLALTNWYFFSDLAHRRKLRKRNQLPEQLMAQRLKTLNELDSLLDHSTRPSDVPEPLTGP
jgi:hypothetical protein